MGTKKGAELRRNQERRCKLYFQLSQVWEGESNNNKHDPS